jgi:hypothetical protein
MRKAHGFPDLRRVISDVSWKVQNSGVTTVLHTNQVLALDGALLRVLPDIADRNLLLRRIRCFLSSRRRGRLRLPGYFPREVRLLSELTKRQLRDRVFAVRPNTSLEQRLPEYLVRRINREFPGMLWNSPRTVLGHMASIVGMLRLRKIDWPGISRQRWPSTPSFSEMLAMSRRGLVTVGLDKLRFTVRNCITRKQVSDDIRLARKIVTKNIIGIRSSVKVPEGFLPYFRYRNGISFLAVRYNLPAGLIRFLIGHWIKCPFNLWLKENCRFKNFLNRHTPSDFVREVVSYSQSTTGSRVPCAGKREMEDSNETLEPPIPRNVIRTTLSSSDDAPTERQVDKLLGPPCAVRCQDFECPHDTCMFTWWGHKVMSDAAAEFGIH